MTFLLRTYEVTVRGRAPATYLAASRSKARAAGYSVFNEVWGWSFRDYIGQVTSIRLVPWPSRG